MTAQTPEFLIHRGRRWDLLDTPLAPLLDRWPKARRPRGRCAFYSTANWRAYVGTWTFRGDRLFLVDLDVDIEDPEVEPDKHGLRHRKARFEEFFPRHPSGRFADWVTDRLVCAEGLMVSYVHMGFSSAWERLRIFDVVRGRLVGEYLQIEPPDAVTYRCGPDGEIAGLYHPDDLVLSGRPTEDPLAGRPLHEAWRIWSPLAKARREAALNASHVVESGLPIGATEGVPPEGAKVLRLPGRLRR